MYELMSLKVKCPTCGNSLMDHDQLIDNEPSIKLDVVVDQKKDKINLSSIYGSYNYKSNIELAQDKIVQFFCPHCTDQIVSDLNCLSCKAPMVPFHLHMGGKVSICSRTGCKDHKVEFDDLAIALNKLYQEYGFGAEHANMVSDTRPRKKPGKIKKTSEKKEIIESGTFLQTYCPHCKKTLIEDGMLKVKIQNGESGYLILSPYLNVFSSKSTVFLPEDKTIKNVSCPHCDETLISKNIDCGKCGSPVAKIALSARTKLLDFYLCTKKGCKWHGLSEGDLYDIRLDDSDEW